MKNMLMMSKNFSTPIDVWLSMPLSEFSEWIRAGNDVVREIDESIRKK